MLKTEIEVYISFLTPSYIYIKGRIIKPYGSLSISKDSDGLTISFFKSILRALSWEIRNHPIKINISDTIYDTKSDEEGYFKLLIPSIPLKSLKGSVTINLKDTLVTQTFNLRDYRKSSATGIISDIDDTILHTEVNGFFKLKMIFNSLLINPFRRKSIEYANLFYQQIVKEGHHDKPIIYISNSPWNMHSYLKDFIVHNNFPKGEIKLRDFGLQTLRKKKEIELQDKYLEVEKMLKIFSETKFTLIGDSAEMDFDIYNRINDNYPERIERIIIIKTGNSSNEERISKRLRHANHKVLFLESYKDLIDNPQE